MLTIAKLHGQSVAYYESTVAEQQGENTGPDGYYSEDGTKPAEAWIAARSESHTDRVSHALGVGTGAVVGGDKVRDWFNHGLAPSGVKLGRSLGVKGVPGFDLTFCAPKSVSLVWGLTDDPVVRRAVDVAHAQAVKTALAYLSEHAGYTRRGSDHDPEVMIIDRVEALSGVKYEHRTSRAGDPHVHSHVLLANKQLCRDGRWRTLDGKSLYHEARAAGMVYQSVLREELSQSLGVRFGEITNGCAEIVGLDDPDLLAGFSTRSREIDAWREANGLEDTANFDRIAQKKTRQTKDLTTSLADLEAEWKQRAQGLNVDQVLATPSPYRRTAVSPALFDYGELAAVVTAQRSTFTRADVVEAVTELVNTAGADPVEILARVEHITDEFLRLQGVWSVTPEKARDYDQTMREGAQRFTTDGVVAQVDHAIDLATRCVWSGVSAESITPVEGRLSVEQAEAMRAVVSSRYLASVVIAPAGAGKTSSLKAARRAWEQAGKTVVGLAPTGKAADVMVSEEVAHSSSTLARILGKLDSANSALTSKTAGQTDSANLALSAKQLGWGPDHVIVIDEAGMVGNDDLIQVLEIAAAGGARVVMVGDPHQYSAVKARGGLLSTLAYELPDAVELNEVFRQRDEKERQASKWLRTGNEVEVNRAADFYAEAGRLHAGSMTAMLGDALAGWEADTSAGKQSLLVASNHDYVNALNVAAQKIMADRGVLDLSESVQVASGQFAHVGDVVLTTRNNYSLITSAGDVVRNGQRWQVEAINSDGSLSLRRADDTCAQVVIGADYASEHVQLGYASTGHASQGATVDVARVVAGVGQVDKAGVYVPLTRGREGNYLYMAESMPGDTETGHGSVEPTLRRESVKYARELLVLAATKSGADMTPHELYRQAREDFMLARLSSNMPTEADPFAGTPLSGVVEAREAKRVQRLTEFYAQSAPGPTSGQSAPEYEDEDAMQASQSPETDGGFGARIKQCQADIADIDARIERVRDQRDTYQSKSNAERRKKQALLHQRDNRGWFARTFKPHEFDEELDQVEQQAQKYRRHADQCGQQLEHLQGERDDLAAELKELRQAEKDEHLSQGPDFSLLRRIYGDDYDPFEAVQVQRQRTQGQTQRTQGQTQSQAEQWFQQQHQEEDTRGFEL